MLCYKGILFIIHISSKFKISYFQQNVPPIWGQSYLNAQVFSVLVTYSGFTTHFVKYNLTEIIYYVMGKHKFQYV